GEQVPPEPAGRRPVRAGWRFLRGNPPARTPVLAGTLHAAAGATYLAMLLPWADQQLGVPPAGDARLALVVSCWGLGAIVGCAVSPALLRRLGPVRLARRSLLGSLACGLAVWTCTHWLPAVLAGLLWGAVHTVVMKAVKDAVGQPALPAARLLWRGIGPVAGAALAGAVAVTANPRAGLAVGVALLAVAALLIRRGGTAAPAGSLPAQATQATTLNQTTLNQTP
ncbi:MAG TPA: MFS transporter, partial [Pseudonocardiaceae bacterium]|nr:MFS transporter [Pseudonocardiaceae bacterium]